MKLNTTIFLLLFCTAIFVIGCDSGSKPDYPEETDDDTVSDIDSDTANDDADSSGNETDEDEDLTPVSDSDIDNNPTDEPHPHDDADSEPDDTDYDTDSEPNDTDEEDDSDSEPNDTDDKDDTDSDQNPDQDTDNINPDEDIDQELPDIDEKDDPAVLCTGQTKCFNNTSEMTSCPASKDKKFFGQDAQYTAENGYCLAKSLDATTDLVTDNITGLVWQRNLPSTYAGCSGSNGELCSYSEAVNYCNNLTYGGYSDWRLPTPKEFETIIDYSKINPALDLEKFPNTQGQPFWTSEAYDYEKNWAVSFLKGETTGNKVQSYLYVRCVTGEVLPDNSFTVSGTGEKVVEDSVNNLIWTKSFGDYSTWKDALAYCKNLEYAGLTEWRLPNINELKTLINYSKSSKPASDFEGMESTSFWSSTSYSGDATNAWAVDMTYGTTLTQSKDNEFKVICVK